MELEFYYKTGDGKIHEFSKGVEKFWIRFTIVDFYLPPTLTYISCNIISRNLDEYFHKENLKLVLWN